MVRKTGFILPYSSVTDDEKALVGQTAIPYGKLARAGIPLSPGFIISSDAYFQFLKHNTLTAKIKHILATVNFDRPESLLQASSYICRYIREAEVQPDVVSDIFGAYKRLGGVFHHATVMVIASETTGHLFRPGEFEHTLRFSDITGEANLLVNIKTIWSSLFDAHAIFRRHRQEVSHFSTGMAIIVQQMATADASGELFTADPVSGDKNRIIIEARKGISDDRESKQIVPDYYAVAKNDLLLLKKNTASQKIAYHRVGQKIVSMKVPEHEQKMQKLTDKEITQLALLGKKLEQELFFPQLISWNLFKNTVTILHTKPLPFSEIIQDKQTDITKSQFTASGIAASPGIATGRVKILMTAKEMAKVMPGDIVVTTQTHEALVPAIKKAAAVVAEFGGLTSHAAFLCRSLGIPAVIGVEHILSSLKDGMTITVNGSSGKLFAGNLAQQTSAPGIQAATALATKVSLTITNPQNAGDVAQLPADGVGILYAEPLFNQLGVHPKRLIHEQKGEQIITSLADQIALIAQAFYPRHVIYRTSDFTTAQYRMLQGGRQYEPIEANPLLGYHGAFRYMHDPELFSLEIKAIVQVRNKKNLKNISLMVPFVRSLHELTEVKRLISAAGLYRSPTCKFWLQVQIPANAMMLESFQRVGIDGIVVDPDILTSLLLATDSANDDVIQAYDIFSPGVLSFYDMLMTQANNIKLPVAMSGKAVARHPSFVEKAVLWGVNTITVNPEAVIATRETIANAERKIVMKR